MRVTAAPSATLCASTVTQSSDLQAGTTPAVLSRPTVGLTPTQRLNAAGTRPGSGKGISEIMEARYIHILKQTLRAGLRALAVARCGRQRCDTDALQAPKDPV